VFFAKIFFFSREQACSASIFFQKFVKMEEKVVGLSSVGETKASFPCREGNKIDFLVDSQPFFEDLSTAIGKV
jgi:hypothetical protein